MSNESAEPRGLPEDLPPSLEVWLSERAEAAGVGREEFVIELLASVQAATGADAGAALDELLENRLDRYAERRLDDRVEDLVDTTLEDRENDRFQQTDDRLETLRRRIVQLKRESEETVDAEQFEETVDRLDALADSLDTLDDRLDAVEGAIEGLETTVSELGGEPEGGAPEEHLAEIDSKLNRLARAVVSLRDAEGDHRLLAELKRSAARKGFDWAGCGACGEAVDLSLLAEPTCPHCGSAVTRVDTSGSEPALEAEVEGEDGG